MAGAAARCRWASELNEPAVLTPLEPLLPATMLFRWLTAPFKLRMPTAPNVSVWLTMVLFVSASVAPLYTPPPVIAPLALKVELRSAAEQRRLQPDVSSPSANVEFQTSPTLRCYFYLFLRVSIHEKMMPKRMAKRNDVSQSIVLAP